MAESNGFKDVADYLGNILRADPQKVSIESLTNAANFYTEKLIPQIPKSLLKKEHMRDHVKVVVEEDQVKVVFDDTAFYWRFVENGTPNQRAQHFASGTFEQYREQIEKLMTEEIMKLQEG